MCRCLPRWMLLSTHTCDWITSVLQRKRRCTGCPSPSCLRWMTMRCSTGWSRRLAAAWRLRPSRCSHASAHLLMSGAAGRLA
jgi:hypothetical protein